MKLGNIVMKNVKANKIRTAVIGILLATTFVMEISNPKLIRAASEIQEINVEAPIIEYKILGVKDELVPTADDVSAEVEEAVYEMERYKAQLEEEMRIKAELERQREIEEYVNSISCDPNDITKITGLKLEDMQYLTEGTWWEGNEQALYDLEQNYGVSALFAMAVSTLESGHGTSSRARNRNNYYGMELKKVWSSLYDNTQYWGNLISTRYVGSNLSSVKSISKVYCPPNQNKWTSYNSSQMKSLYSDMMVNIKSAYDVE